MTTDNNLAEVDVTTNPVSVSRIAINGLFGGLGGMTRGPGGCIYVSSDVNVLRLTGLDGTCAYTNTATAPTLSLTPTSVTPNPAQGSAQTFTAIPHFGSIAAGTPITFSVVGANPQIKLVRTDANGQSTFDYTAVKAGDDTVVASTTISDTAVTSNPARVTWTPGRHTTFLTLNPSPKGGTVGQAVAVVASLTDISASPVAALAGETIEFTLGGATCSATTDANGIATCSVTPDPAGMTTLAAHFAGTSQFVATTDSVGFNVMTPAVANRAPDCRGATGQPLTLWPPNHKLVLVSIAGVVEPDGDPVTIVIRSIRQDEPVNGLGDGDTAPDGFGIGNATAQVRAERAGNGNGRVYRIGFEANDGKGATCIGEVRVGVPHNQKKPPIDNGPLYDSTAR
jgi:hypothetical protein